jgi:hypothetical protein
MRPASKPTARNEPPSAGRHRLTIAMPDGYAIRSRSTAP